MAGLKLRGKLAEYNALVETWWSKLYGIAYAKTADRDQAHDMVQEVMLTVWEKWDTVPHNEEIEFYLLHALRYRVLNHYRSSGRYKVQLQQLDDLLHEISDSEDEHAFADQRLTLAAHAVTLLAPSLRRVFTLRIEKGYSYDKIAALLDIDPGSARVLYSRALEQLRKSVAARPTVAVSVMMALQLVTIS